MIFQRFFLQQHWQHFIVEPFLIFRTYPSFSLSTLQILGDLAKHLKGNVDTTLYNVIISGKFRKTPVKTAIV
jgi:hypothetical protein